MSNRPTDTTPCTTPTSPPEAHPPQAAGLGEKIKEQARKAGQAIDRGMASLLKEGGQHIRVTCPGCQGVLQAPADELVECPLCKNHFRTPTVSSRTAEIGKSVSEDIRGAVKRPEGKSNVPAHTPESEHRGA
jgi:uncharacterized Zn finger protein (UPF0148 family)